MGRFRDAPRKRALISLRDREGSVKPASFAWKHSCVLPPGSMTCPSPRSSVLFDAEALRHVFLAAPVCLICIKPAALATAQRACSDRGLCVVVDLKCLLHGDPVRSGTGWVRVLERLIEVEVKTPIQLQRIVGDLYHMHFVIPLEMNFAEVI